MRLRFNRSLSAHLRESEDHSRLPFHPSGPVCRRDRLAGSLDGEELVSRRTQAAIAAGVLAFSTGSGSAAALASPPDEVSEGNSEVVSGGGQSSDPVFDPGLETAQLPDEASITPAEPTPSTDGEDLGALEHEPATDTVELVMEGDVEAATEPSAEPPPTAERSAPTPPTAGTPTPPPPPEPTVPAAAPAPESVPQAPAKQAEPKAVGGQRREAPDDDAGADEPAQARTAPAVADPIPVAAPAHPRTVPSAELTGAAAPAAAAPEAAMVAYREATGRAASGTRFHTVRPGESLWSIAADLLGDRATVPRIARQVDRLWELNEERIATGQPDLLFAGTRLRLR